MMEAMGTMKRRFIAHHAHAMDMPMEAIMQIGAMKR
jgi:hypothetical protein